MIDTKKLQGKMREKGMTLNTLSEKMKLSRTGLFNKIHGKKEFLCSEVQIICEYLSLNGEDVQSIFFAKNVEYNSTE